MTSDIDAYLAFAWRIVSDASLLAVLWWLTLCALVAWLARAKGQSAIGFFLIALVFTPLSGFLAVIAARDREAAAETRAANAIVRELLGPLALQVDGIRAHLTVSRETAELEMAETALPKRVGATVV